MQINFEDFLTVAFSIKSEVNSLVNIVLVNHSELRGYITVLDKEVRWFRIDSREAALRLGLHSEKRGKLRIVLWRSDIEVLIEFTRLRVFLLIELEML